MKHHRGARLRAVVLVATCALALAACGGDADKDREKSSSDKDADLSGSIPEVIDFGEGDRRSLAYDLSAGDRTTTTFDVAITVAQDSSEVATTIPIRVVTTARVLDVGAATSKVRTTITDVSVDGHDLDPAKARELQSSLGPAEGFALTRTTTPSGSPYRTDFSREDDAALRAVQGLSDVPGLPFSQVSVEFPAEPVAEGAVWRRTGQVDYDSYAVITYTLQELDGDDYRISYELVAADPQDAASVPPGAGELTGTLHSAMFTSMTGETKQESDADSGGSTTHVTTTVHFEATSS